MKESYKLTTDELRECLIDFQDTILNEVSYDPPVLSLIHPMNKRHYKSIRKKLTTILDQLAFPIPDLNYNNLDTDLGDFTDTLSYITDQHFPEERRNRPVTRDELLQFKETILNELDAMTER